MGGIVDLPAGSITAPGMLPADASDQGIEVSWRGRAFPTVPHSFTPAGSLLAQAICSTVGTRMVGPGEVMVEPARFGLLLDVEDLFSEKPFELFGAFLDAWVNDDELRRSSDGVRIDVLGPTSLALALAAAGLPRPQATDAGRLVVASLAARMLGEFQRVAATVGGDGPAHPVAVVMYEPALVGSMHPTFPLTARELRTMIDPVVDHIDRQSGDTPVLIGVQVPGRADWQTLITSGISMLCAPPDSALVGCAEWVQSFLANGGWMAWGAVPVDRPLGASEELLWRHLAGTWSDLVAAGVDPTALGRQCMLGPSAGLERFATAQIPGLLDLLEAMSERVRSEALITRLRFNSGSPTLLN